MEFNEKEISAVQVVVTEGQDQLPELSLLQLALVGGGVGEVIFG